MAIKENTLFFYVHVSHTFRVKIKNNFIIFGIRRSIWQDLLYLNCSAYIAYMGPTCIKMDK